VSCGPTKPNPVSKLIFLKAVHSSVPLETYQSLISGPMTFISDWWHVAWARESRHICSLVVIEPNAALGAIVLYIPVTQNSLLASPRFVSANRKRGRNRTRTFYCCNDSGRPQQYSISHTESNIFFSIIWCSPLPRFLAYFRTFITENMHSCV
jgi:hypothetical protein